MRIRGFCLLAVGVLAVGSSAVAQTGAGKPRGVTIGRDGYATIRTAPPSPTTGITSQRPSYRTQYEWYAQEHGLTLDEAKRRMGEQHAIIPAFERLQERLRRLEPDNYISARVNHLPDWSYTLFFKRDPQATLRRYSVNPRFTAASGKYALSEAQAMTAEWGQRFAKAKIGGTMMFPFEDRVEMTVPMTAREFRAISAREKWGEVPPQIRLSFAREMAVPRVDPRVARYVRGFASESLATTLQLQRGSSGRVVLDNGCLRLATKGKAKGPLVVFHKETGIGLDAQGYLAAIDRDTGQSKGRVGEMWSWAGPNPGTQFDGLEELKAACGDGPIENVGNPESEAVFDARHR